MRRVFLHLHKLPVKLTVDFASQIKSWYVICGSISLSVYSQYEWIIHSSSESHRLPVKSQGPGTAQCDCSGCGEGDRAELSEQGALSSA